MLQHKATWNKQRDVWEAPEMDLISGRWAVYSETLPRSGSMRNGELFELPTWERATEGQGCSYLPTPVAQPSGNTPEEHLRKKPGREVVTDLAIIAENGLLETGGRLLPTPRTTDMNGHGHHGEGGMDLRTTVTLLPTPSVADVEGGRKHRSGDRADELLLNGIAFHQRFGQYASAIRRHELAFGRVAPEPTAPTGRNGAHRLSSRFVEWMMGLPDGWVTGCGLSRSAELRILGNGVVPRQATAALTEMRTVLENRAAQAA